MKPLRGFWRFPVLCAAAAMLACPSDPNAEAHGCSRGVTLTVGDGTVARITRDDFGIPHVFAETNQGVFEAYGYAVAQDRLWQLELNRRAARGRLAEAFNPDAFPHLYPHVLQADRFVRMTGYTDAEMQAQLAALPAELQQTLEAYATGINRYVTEVVSPDPARRLPFEFHTLDLPPPAWTVLDSVAVSAFLVRRFGEIGGREVTNQLLLNNLIAQNGGNVDVGWAIFSDLRWRNDPDAPVSVPKTGVAAPQPEVRLPPPPSAQREGGIQGWTDREAEARAVWEQLGVPSKLGSYGWAVGPGRSAEGSAMLYGGPQMGASAPEMIHEVQLKGGNGFNVMGMAVAGTIPILIGRTAHIAWTTTSGMGDNLDLYLEELCDGGTGSLFNGSCRPFEVRAEEIHVRGRPSETLTVERSVHGPVVARVNGTHAVSQKRAHWEQELATMAAFFGFNRARTVEEFEQALGAVSTSHNFLYADQSGNIAYWHAGKVPVRPAGFDPRLPFPGNGTAEWPGELRPVPRSVNPAQGYLANWNNKPSVDFDSGDSTRFGKQDRVLEIDAWFANGRHVSLGDMYGIPRDIARVRPIGREARYLLPYLFAALAEEPPTDPVEVAALAVLSAWDGAAMENAISSTGFQPGEIIFTTWRGVMENNTFYDELGDGAISESWASNVLLHLLDHEVAGRSGVPPMYNDYLDGVAPYVAIRAAFSQAVAALAAERGSNPWEWTDPRPMTPLVHPLLGVLGTFPLSNRATYAQIVVLDQARPRGLNILTLGQSGFVRRVSAGAPAPDPHFMDQLPLYYLFKYKPMQFLDGP